MPVVNLEREDSFALPYIGTSKTVFPPSSERKRGGGGGGIQLFHEINIPMTASKETKLGRGGGAPWYPPLGEALIQKSMNPSEAHACGSATPMGS